MKLKITLAQIAFLIFSIVFFNSCVSEGDKEGAPTHIRAMFKEDPATSVVIGWNRLKNSDAIDDMVYYDTVDHGQDLASYAFSEKPHKYTEHKKIYSAFIHLRNLEPDTKYYFVIQNSFGISYRYYVQTLPDTRDTRISFIAGGDSRNNREPRQAANQLVAKLKPHYVLFGGDMTDNGSSKQWWRWFDDWQLTHGPDGRVTPIVTARGNHESSNSILVDYFWLTKDNYYALNIADGLIRTYVLNSEMAVAGDQTTWLVNDLAANRDVVWIMASYHKPIRPHVKKKAEGTVKYLYWAPTFYEYGVNLVFESDAHTVKSTYPIRPSISREADEGFVRDDENGTTYVGEGCWGAPLRSADDNKDWTRASGKFNQFKLVFVDREKIELRTIKVDNADEVGEVDLNDRFELPENLDVWNPESGDVITIE